MNTRPFELHLRDYLRVVFKHLWIVLLSVAVVCATVWVTSREQPVIYRTTGLIEVRGVRPAILDQRETQGAAYEAAKEFRTLMELIQSNQLSERVSDGLPPEVRGELGSTDPVHAAAALRGRIEVSQRAGTNLVMIGLTGHDPRSITEIVNAHMVGFRDWNEDRLRGKIGIVLDQLQKELDGVEGRVTEARARLFKFRDDHPEVDFENPDTNQGKIANDLNAQLVQLMLRQVQLEGQVEQVKAAGKDVAAKRGLPEVQKDAGLQQLESDERELRKQLLLLQQRGLGEGHQEVMRTSAQLAENLRLQDVRVERVTGALVFELEDLNRQIGRIGALVEKHQAIWHEYNRTLNGYKNLSEELATRQSALQRHLHLIDEARQGSQTQYESVQIIDEAKVPTSPIPTGVGVGYVFGVLMGLAIGIGLAFFLEYLDDTVRTREDVEKYMDVPLLGHIPYIDGDRDQPESKDTITHRQVKSTVSEAYRTVRTSLVYSIDSEAGATGPLALVITSAGPREGKTTNAVNLAITMAHSGSRVLLVDADLRRPRIHRSFAIDHEVGLTNYLAGADGFESIVRRSPIENLDLVTSGPLPPNPYELLGSPRMQEFLAVAKSRYDCVIIDTPPIGAVSDACLLGGLADGVVQIVSAAKTRRRIARLGKEQLAKVGATLIGVILNCAAPLKSSYYGYYYYYDSGYYNYYHYYGDEESPEGGPRRGRKKRRSEAGKTAS